MARLRMLLGTTALLLALAADHAAALPGHIVIVNADGAGEGFNEATAASPVGGNPGVTVGAQRLNLFQHAADIWGAILQNTDTIYVVAQFNPLTCTPTSAVLGSAGPKYIANDFPGAIFAGTLYHIALANNLSASRLDAGLAQGEITATFNSSLNGSAGCLGGAGWYYGYDGLEGSNVELLPVVLHEIGHGLGFSTTTNGSTGAFNSGLPGTFDHFLFDAITGRVWSSASETAGQRVTSAVSGDKLSWAGPAGIYGVTHYPLTHRPKLTVNSPVVTGIDSVDTASFGGALTLGGVTGNVVLVNDGTGTPTFGCITPLSNAGAVNGNIAFADRGTCSFVAKAQAAQAAGATALIIANNAAGTLSPTGTDPSLTIPIITVTLSDGNALKAVIGSGLNVTIGLDPVLYAGADASNRPLMYAPNPFQSGSSVSHFDVSMLPNALMEPAINNDLSSNVDLTKHVFVDIGWLPMSTPTALAMFTAEDREEGILLQWQFGDDSDIASLTLQRSTGEAGPWSTVDAELFTRDGRTAALDASAQAGETYYYRLDVVDHQGAESHFGLVVARHEFARGGPAVLFSPSPNPASMGTRVGFRLARPEFVRLTITDAAGRRVQTLQEGVLPPGEHARWWDGTGGGRSVPPGLYFASLRTSEGMHSQRIAIIR